MNTRTSRVATISGLTLLVMSTVVFAQDWSHWRGPAFNGSTQATGLPSDFTRKKGVKWVASLPGPGASTPIVLGDRVLLSSVDTERDRLVALCLDRKTGEVRWSRDADGEVPGATGSRTQGGQRTTYASPSPTTDVERVVFFFGNGDLVAYDLDGKELWRRNIQGDYGKFAFQWTFSASPTLWEGLLYLPVMQRDTPVGRGGGRRGRGGRGQGGDRATEAEAPIESFVLVIDPTTGKTLHKTLRPSPARVESREAYTTMIPFVQKDGRKEMLCLGGDVLTGHDPKSGKELWRWGTWNEGHRLRDWRLVPTVVVGEGLALVCAPKRAPVYAVRLGGDGDLGEKALAWESKGRPNPVSSDVPTPAFADGAFYVLSDVATAISKVDAKTGEVAWTTELPSDFLWRASPTVADGKVWLMNHAGEVYIISTKDGSVLHHTPMADEDEDQIRSSIVIAHGSIFIRTNKHLFCIAN
jgi:outer membrane protein assembly factor BamB